MKKLTLQLSSISDRDDLVVEIWNEENQFAEIYVENDDLKIDIYFLSEDCLSFNLGELQELFSEAAQLLNYQIN